MSTMSAFTLRTLKKNRARTLVSIVGIALSCALITAVFTSVASLQAALYDRTLATEGSWHVHSSELTEDEAADLAADDRVKAALASRELGSARLSEREADTLGTFLAVRTLPEETKGGGASDGASLTLLPELAEGRMPASADEIILPDYVKDETLGADGGGAVSDGPLSLNSTLSLNLGVRVLDDGSGQVLNSSAYPLVADETEEMEVLDDVEARTYTVTGFYHRVGPWRGNEFAAGNAIVGITSADAAAKEDPSRPMPVSIWIATEGIGNVDGMEELMFDAAPEAEAIYHSNLFRYLGIVDDRPLWNSLWAIAAVLAAVIVVASVSLIYNSFSISVADRTRQFGLLASVGASKRQLRRSVLFEALALGVIGVPLGIVVGLGGAAGVFALTQDAFAGLLGSEEGLAVHVDWAALAAAALLSFATLFVSAWIPARRASRVSAIEAVRQTQDVRLSGRARRRAAKEAAAGSAAAGRAFKRGGIWGRLFGVPGTVAKRNLSRASARGRSVVASLAVSVALLITAGSIASYLAPFSGLAEATDGAGTEADIAVHASNVPYDLRFNAEELEAFQDDLLQMEGVRFVGSYRQGQIEAVLPASMVSDEGRALRESHNAMVSQSEALESFAEDGSYMGEVMVYYLDEASWAKTVESAGGDLAAYTDPEHPRAIGLNIWQGWNADGTYATGKPFGQTGTIEYYRVDGFPDDDADRWAMLGVIVGADGLPAAGYFDRDSGTSLVEMPLDQVAQRHELEVGAFVDELPPFLNLSSALTSFPVLLLPDSLTDPAWDASFDPQDKSADERGGSYDLGMYWWANSFFTADDHAKAAELMEDIASQHTPHDPESDGARGSGTMYLQVNDYAEQAESMEALVQAIELFIFSFSIIMTLIAVANVFNTLTNSIILRTREFAMLKSMGMGDAAFVRMLGCECASYAVRGFAIGLAAGSLVTLLLYFATRQAFANVGFILPWMYVGLAGAVVLAVLVISVVYALRRSHATNVVEALRADAV